MNRHEIVREKPRARRVLAAPCALSFALHASALVLCTTLHWGSPGRGAGARSAGDGDGDEFTLRLGRATVLAAASSSAQDAPPQLAEVAPASEELVERVHPPAEPDVVASHAVELVPSRGVELAPLVAPEVTSTFVSAPELALPPVTEPALETEHAARDVAAADVASAGAGAPTRDTPQTASAVSAATSAPVVSATETALAPATPANGTAKPLTSAEDAVAPGTAASAAPSAGATAARAAPTSGVASSTGSGGPDHGPRVIAGPRPVYPPESELRGEYGKVVCNVFVDARGTVEKVDVVRSSGFARLDRAAIAGLSRWRFEPAVEHGVQVASQFRHTVSFVFE